MRRTSPSVFDGMVNVSPITSGAGAMLCGALVCARAGSAAHMSTNGKTPTRQFILCAVARSHGSWCTRSSFLRGLRGVLECIQLLLRLLRRLLSHPHRDFQRLVELRA